MQHVRRHLDGLWQRYRDCALADAHFLNQFPIQTRQRVWELETAWFLHNCGFTLSSGEAGSDFRCASQDFAFEVVDAGKIEWPIKSNDSQAAALSEFVPLRIAE